VSYTGPLADPEEVPRGLNDPASNVFLDWSTFWSRDRREPEWLLDDVLARGRGHALYARRKDGKSLFLLDAGMKLIDAGVRVVYLDYEMTEDDVYERLEDMGRGPASDLSRLHYALLPTLPPLDTREGGLALLGLLDEVGRADEHLCLVIDTTSRATFGDENLADTIRAFYRWTGIGLKRRGVTWARLDHEGKDPTRGQRGSSAKADDVDIVWRLVRTEGGVTLHREASRVGWVPSVVPFHKLADPVRFVRVAEDWPVGTNEVAELLDSIGIPIADGMRAAAKALREAGHKRKNEVIRAAQRYRRRAAEEAKR
jgi:KaiC/GvpD/RAD55 family RecA-like ATPase